MANAPLKTNAGVFSAIADESGISVADGIVTADGALVELYDVAGQKVAEGYAVDLGGFTPGVYVARSGSKSLKIVR